MDEQGLPQDDEPIRLDHEDVVGRLEALRRKTSTATEELVDLTLVGLRSDLVVLPEPGAPTDR
jgi:hypothetical protein